MTYLNPVLTTKLANQHLQYTSASLCLLKVFLVHIFEPKYLGCWKRSYSRYLSLTSPFLAFYHSCLFFVGRIAPLWWFNCFCHRLWESVATMRKTMWALSESLFKALRPWSCIILPWCSISSKDSSKDAFEKSAMIVAAPGRPSCMTVLKAKGFLIYIE